MTFQKDLGSYYDKTQRVQRLCSWLSEILKQSGIAVRPGVVHKAACLAKTDLTTELVKEFTELQGIVGGLYARAQQLDPTLPEATRLAIADAIYDHYKPESTDDRCAAVDGRRGALDRRQGRHDRRNVCAGTGAERVEGSLRAAAAGERDREGDCREEAAAAAGRSDAGCAGGISEVGGGEEVCRRRKVY